MDRRWCGANTIVSVLRLQSHIKQQLILYSVVGYNAIYFLWLPFQQAINSYTHLNLGLRGLSVILNQGNSLFLLGLYLSLSNLDAQSFYLFV